MQRLCNKKDVVHTSSFLHSLTDSNLNSDRECIHRYAQNKDMLTAMQCCSVSMLKGRLGPVGANRASGWISTTSSSSLTIFCTSGATELHAGFSDPLLPGTLEPFMIETGTR